VPVSHLDVNVLSIPICCSRKYLSIRMMYSVLYIRTFTFMKAVFTVFIAALANHIILEPMLGRSSMKKLLFT
jgi:hypothetical protein